MSTDDRPRGTRQSDSDCGRSGVREDPWVFVDTGPVPDRHEPVERFWRQRLRAFAGLVRGEHEDRGPAP